MAICWGKGQAIQTQPQFTRDCGNPNILKGTWITDIHAPRTFAAMSPTSAHTYYIIHCIEAANNQCFSLFIYTFKKLKLNFFLQNYNKIFYFVIL